MIHASVPPLEIPAADCWKMEDLGMMVEQKDRIKTVYTSVMSNFRSPQCHKHIYLELLEFCFMTKHNT